MEATSLMPELEHHPLNRRIYYKVRELIESGAIAPGSQLDERTLAESLAVSRTPLREAIATLVEEGLVERRPYRGNFVRVFTIKQINDLFEVRKALEGLASRLAVPKLSDAHLKELYLILDESQVALERGDLAAYSVADQRFHRMMAQITENETLIESLGRLGRQIQMIRVSANRDPHNVERTAQERTRILNALESRNAELTAQLMEEHIEGVRRSVVSQIEAALAKQNTTP
jgi:DNA-binding GntR family transcriptional regulator